METRELKRTCHGWSLQIVLIIIISFFTQGCKTATQGIKTTLRAKPNIVLISVDTLRPDHLSCYGYKRNTTPNVDGFAREGVLFENCFSHAPETSSSCASLLSGFLPHETKVIENNSIVHPNG